MYSEWTRGESILEWKFSDSIRIPHIASTILAKTDEFYMLPFMFEEELGVVIPEYKKSR